jgi:hypothetical protein
MDNMAIGGTTPRAGAFTTLTASTAIGIASGGTGQTTANAAFNALAPSQTGNSGKYLTTDGTDTSWASNPLGTVTSVAATVPSFLSISGSPITTSGTLAFGLSGTALPTTSGGTGLTSFTANGVVYASSSSALTTGSALTFDGAEFGFTRATGPFFRSTESSTGITSYFGSYSVGLYLGTTSNHPIQFIVNSAEQMRLTSTGLGIGTSLPAYKLDVNGVANFADNTIHLVGGQPMFARGGASMSYLYAGTTALEWRNNADTAALMRLDSSGNLGIGTSSPSSKLTVGDNTTPAINLSDAAGSVKAQLIYRNSTTGNLELTNTTSAALVFGTNNTSRARFDSSGNFKMEWGTTSLGWYFDSQYSMGMYSVAGTRTLYIDNQSSDSGGAIVFRNTITGTLSEKARIDNAGNFGIGTSSPNAKLTVGDSSGAALGIPTTATFYGTSSISSSIGTVGLFSTETAAADVGPILTFGGKSGNTYSPYPFAFIQGAKASATAGDYSGYLRFITTPSDGGSPVERMRISSTGNVGIGTSSPSTALTVVGNIKAGYESATGIIFGLAPSGVPSNDVNAYVLWGNDSTFGGVNGDLIYIPRTSAGASHRFYTGSGGLANEKMRISNNGNVGIGTNNPTQNLSVAASACIVDVTSTTGTNFNGLEMKNSGGSFYFGIDNSAGTFYGTSAYAGAIYRSGAYPIVFSTDGTQRLSITGSGDVAIFNGKTLYFNNASNTANASIVCVGGASLSLRSYGNEMISLYEDNTIIFKVGSGSEKARINSSGQLLVGTTTSKDVLTVSNGISMIGGGAGNTLQYSGTDTRTWASSYVASSGTQTLCRISSPNGAYSGGGLVRVTTSYQYRGGSPGNNYAQYMVTTNSSATANLIYSAGTYPTITVSTVGSGGTATLDVIVNYSGDSHVQVVVEVFGVVVSWSI